MTITLPSAVPIGTQYWKCQNGVWYRIPIGDDNGDNIITIQVTDGGTGDADGNANGTIHDPGGSGNPPPPPSGGVGGEVSPINKLEVLAPWIVLAVLLIGGMGWFALRRRKV